jgi:hypothetical protein
MFPRKRLKYNNKLRFLRGPYRNVIIDMGLEVRQSAVCNVEAESNTCTVALRVAGGEEKGTQCLGVQLCRPVPGGYIKVDLALQDGGVWNLRQ